MIGMGNVPITIFPSLRRVIGQERRAGGSAKTSSPRGAIGGRVPTAVSFLFPLYFLGAAALAVPILLHLRRRPPKEHLEFGSLMFLEKTPERLVRRARLERLVLLALRCLALLLLASAFARPFLASVVLPTEEESLTRAVILVDRSASMRREGLWDAAREAALEAAGAYGGGAEVALALFDEGFELAADLPAFAGLGAGAKAAAAGRLLAGAEPSWLGTDLGGAMVQAAGLLLSADAARPANRREIVVVGDFQTGAKRDRLGESPWPQEVAVRSVPLVPEEPGNLSLALAAAPPRGRIDEEEVYRVRIANAADSPSSSAALLWKGFPETRTEILVAPGAARIVTSPPRPAGAERGTLVVEGDAHPFDNEVHVAPVQPRPLRVRYLGAESGAEQAGSPLFYLRRALQPTPALHPVVTAAEGVEGLDPAETEVVVAAETWSTAEGEALHRFAGAGGLVVALPTPETESAAFAALVGETGWTLREAAVRDFALLSDLDFGHPVLAPFARAQIRDFTRIRFWRHRELDFGEDGAAADTRVVARFDGKHPALLEHRVGEGSVFAFLAGWRPEESQLALSSKFVPLLYSLLEHAGYSIRSAPSLHVGETDHPAPGFYEEPLEDGGVRTVAVNLDPAEGRTEPFDPAVELPALGIPLAEAAGAPEAGASETGATQTLRVENEKKEEKQKLWKWLVLAALIALVAETWLAGRRPASRASASPAARQPAA